VCVEVEVVDVPLDYNLLLGRSWTYAMTIVVSMFFECYVSLMKGGLSLLISC
jgi:hypothetical protein